MKRKKIEKRMYFLNMYNLSQIQTGIQSLHACVEYQLKYGKDAAYKEWAKTHKTVILLNGGTSNSGEHSHYGYPLHTGSMESHFAELKKNKIKCAAFHEPDLNYAMSSIAFLVDERVFNKKEYPDFDSKFYLDVVGGKERAEKDFKKEVGKDVYFLKNFLKNFRLA